MENIIANEEALFELLTMTCEVDQFGTKHYFNKEGELHRIYGPAVIHPDEDQEWYKNDLLHREDGPAMIYGDGYKAWCKNGKYHREDGAAVTYADGREKYYIDGELLTKNEFQKWQKDNGINPIE